MPAFQSSEKDVESPSDVSPVVSKKLDTEEEPGTMEESDFFFVQNLNSVNLKNK